MLIILICIALFLIIKFIIELIRVEREIKSLKFNIENNDFTMNETNEKQKNHDKTNN